MKVITISTKEIRNDLEGFLKKLKYGQTIQVMYRSKPLVTLAAKETGDSFLNDNAGTPSAGKHSVAFVARLPKRQPRFDANKDFKELYNGTKTI